MFHSLMLRDWRQFELIDIEFHPRLTVITGANGSGKTAILRFLARHFGWGYQELGTPIVDRRTGVLRYVLRLLRREVDQSQAGQHEIGGLRYSSTDDVHRIIAPDEPGSAYQPTVENTQPVQGLFIPSHRVEFQYQPVDQIPMRPYQKTEAFQRFSDSVRSRAFGSGGRSPTFFLKETLIGWALFGYGNEIVVADVQKRQLLEEFQDVLRHVLPPSLRFEGLSIRPPEVVLQTGTGQFMLDAVSGGIAALIDLAWQIFTLEPTRSEPIVVVIDEAENHLHATMQRTLLSSLGSTFPTAQFIISTHSPLLVGALRDSTVYVLDYNESGRVLSQKLDFANKAATASEVLRDVLGVPFTAPVWVEAKLTEIAERYSSVLPTAESLATLRAELEQEGLGEYAPQVLADAIATRLAAG